LIGNGSAPTAALTSRKYAREFEQVKSLGALNSTTRTPDQTHAARYWAENPPRTWNRIFQTLSTQQGLSLVENARLFAMLYLTAADTFISVWDDKAHWSFWRPITAIREAADDGNPATEPDPNWLPLIATPPYPDHPSGHTGFSGSVCAVLEEFFGTGQVTLTDTNVGGLTRSWTSFPQMIDEIVNARMWSGIHFLNPDRQGREMGEDVARYAVKHYFGAVDRDADEDD
jgi:PAP2 superfamily